MSRVVGRGYLGNGALKESEEEEERKEKREKDKEERAVGSTVLVLFPVLQHHSSSSIYQRRSCWHRILNETTFGRTYVPNRTDWWTDTDGRSRQGQRSLPFKDGREKSQRTARRA